MQIYFPTAIRPIARLSWALFGLIAAIGVLYVTLIFGGWLGPLNAFWSSDQGVKLIQVFSLLLNKYRTNALLYPGQVYDPQALFSPLRGQYLWRGGQAYAMFSAPFAYLSSIPFFLAGYPGLYLIPILSTLLTLRAYSMIARCCLSPAWVLAGVVILALASPLFFYTLTFWEHTAAVLLVTSALALALDGMRSSNARPLLIAGLFLGAAAWLRNEVILSIPALGLALLVVRPPGMWRVSFWIGGGAALTIGLLLVFNQASYGSFLGPHVLVAGQSNYARATDLSTLIEQRLGWATTLLVPQAHRFVLIDLGLLIAVALASRLTKHRLAIAIGALGVSLLAVRLSSLIQLMLSSGLHSTLLETFPLVLLLALPRAPAEPAAAAEQHAARLAGSLSEERIVSLLEWFAVGYIALAWLAYIPDGGTQWGPRVLLPALPPIVVVVLWRVSGWVHSPSTRQIGLAIAVALVLVSSTAFAGQIYGLRQIYLFNTNNAYILRTVNQCGERVIVTGVWYAPPLLAPIFYDGHLVYLAGTARDFETLVRQLARQGVTRFYYLGPRSPARCPVSAGCPGVALVGQPQPLPNDLVGAVYQMRH
jgi:hypothetical protein